MTIMNKLLFLTAILTILCLDGCDYLKTASTHAPVAPQLSNIYQLVSDSAGHVWKINTATGEMWMCAFGSVGTISCLVAPSQSSAQSAIISGKLIKNADGSFNYVPPAPIISGLNVQMPDGKNYTFPDQQSLNAWKKDSGIP